MKHGIKAKLSVFIGFAVLLTAVVFLSAQREDAKVLELIAGGKYPSPALIFSLSMDAGTATVSLLLAPGYSAGSSDLLYPGWK